MNMRYDMNMIAVTPISPEYKKENGFYVLDIDHVQVPFEIKERSIVYLPPSEFGGNHRHPRQEAFVGFGEDLEFVWNEDGKTRTTLMNPGGQLQLILVPPNLEHVVFNRSQTQMAVLLEFADGLQREVQVAKVV